MVNASERLLLARLAGSTGAAAGTTSMRRSVFPQQQR
jgi:hypothetical protein